MGRGKSGDGWDEARRRVAARGNSDPILSGGIDSALVASTGSGARAAWRRIGILLGSGDRMGEYAFPRHFDFQRHRCNYRCSEFGSNCSGL